MPKQRQTCTRCSQRRQKCDRKAPCARCVQNNEGHLCTTKWVNGYNPNIHRKYPRKPSGASGSDTSSSVPSPDVDSQALLPLVPHAPPTTEARSSQGQPLADSAWRNSLPEISIGAILKEKDADANQTLFDKSFSYARSKGPVRDAANGSSPLAGCYSNAARIVETQYLQSILPSKDKLMLIVDYYTEYMVYWIGGIFHAPSFRRKLLAAYGQSSELDLQSLDWKWTALLCKSSQSRTMQESSMWHATTGKSSNDGLYIVVHLEATDVEYRSCYPLIQYNRLCRRCFSLLGLLT